LRKPKVPLRYGPGWGRASARERASARPFGYSSRPALTHHGHAHCLGPGPAGLHYKFKLVEWERVHLGSREVIRALTDDGWVLVRTKGSHHHFAHPVKPGIVTVPHPRKDLSHELLRSIERQAGITLRAR